MGGRFKKNEEVLKKFFFFFGKMCKDWESKFIWENTSNYTTC